MDFSAFDTNKIEEYTAQAKALWGTTSAYQEYEQKAKDRTAAHNLDLNEQMMEIFAEIGAVKESDPASGSVQALIGKLQDYITEHFYACTDEILSGLGQMYAAGGEMTENIDRYGGEGTAAFTDAAIRVFCSDGA